MNVRCSFVSASLWLLTCVPAGAAQLTMPSVFGDSMVLQRDRPVHLWGWTDAGADVTATIGDDTASATADRDGRFDIELPSRPAGGPHRVVVTAGDATLAFDDVLFGEVWLCSGQSNMRQRVKDSFDGDLLTLEAGDPNIRLLHLPMRSSQQPERDFDAEWTLPTPDAVAEFSAVGYRFGRRLHDTLDVPVGLINNAWGGSAIESWLPTELLADDGRFDELMGWWDTTLADYDPKPAWKKYKAKLNQWAKGGRKGRRPKEPHRLDTGQRRPGNCYGGMLAPLVGYELAGVIWYQGESNAKRAKQYRDLFPLLIRTWRDRWQRPDLPFFWVQLADYRAEKRGPSPSDWAELREAQTMTLDVLDHVGQAVIIDSGEGTDIHPRDKATPASRLARLALADVYGYDLPHESPRLERATFDDGKAILDFKNVGQRLRAHDTRGVYGFTIAGEDRRFHPAKPRWVDGDTIELSSDAVSDPVAARYGWADNPRCNVRTVEGLPLTPFRTDDWPGVTDGVAY